MTNEPISTSKLVSAALEGVESAFKALYDRFALTILNTCIRMTNNRMEAEDILQDSFIKAFENLNQLKERDAFGAWTRKMAVNHCLKKLKEKSPVLEIGQLEFTEHADDDWIKSFDFKTLNEAIRQLPEGARQIFLLYVTEEYTHKEIADTLNISVSTSKSQFARAKDLLKQNLKASIG